MAMLFDNGADWPCIQFVTYLWYLAGTKESAYGQQIKHIKPQKNCFMWNKTVFYAGFIRNAYETEP